MASHSAAVAVAFAIDDNVAVQHVSYAKLALQLTADAQVLAWGAAEGDGIIVDNSDLGATMSGVWSNSASVGGFWGPDYAHDGNELKGNKSFTYRPNLLTNDSYQVYLRWTTNPNRATNVSVDIIHASGTNTVVVNQMLNNGAWVHLLTTNFNAGTNGALRIRNAGTTGFVIADAARWVSTTATNTPVVQLIATDPVTGENGEPAKLLFSRSLSSTNAPMTVFYQLGGTANNGVDFAALNGHVVFLAGVAFTNLTINALPDATADGNKTLAISLKPGTNYAIGTFSNAVVRILDQPFDAWRAVYFSAPELAQPNVSGLTADPDGDGVTNGEEFSGGTNPRDASSYLHVTIDNQINMANIRFVAGPDRTYTIQYTDDLTNGSWQDYTNLPSSIAERVVLYSDPLPANTTNRFYRVTAP
jgi:hypothetical protein